jgi:PAS domain S-box-containing protein
VDGDEQLGAALQELQKTHAALQHEYEKLRHAFASPQLDLRLAIFDKLPMPVWACDRDCKIAFWNEGAVRLYGYSAEEAIGQDFVELFVNPPEQEKARSDCAKIIDENHPIKNMAEDIDKHGNTKALVTHCFPIYDVAGYSGLQVEISYEVQDYDRLKAGLQELQASSRRKQEQIEELRTKLLEETRRRALGALDSQVQTARDSCGRREIAAENAALQPRANLRMIAKARAEIKAARASLLLWERSMRKRVMSDLALEELESIIEEIEQGPEQDV